MCFSELDLYLCLKFIYKTVNNKQVFYIALINNNNKFKILMAI